MTAKELNKATYQVLTGVLPICLNCAYFTQHYIPSVENPGEFVPCNLGHCANTVVRFKQANNTCKYFRKREVIE